MKVVESKASSDLIENTLRWQKNADMIGFSCTITAENKKLIYEFQNCPKKYRKSLTQLTNQILNLAVAYIGEVFSFPVDGKEGIKSVADYLKGKMPTYLATLLDQGFPAFHSAVSKDAQVLEFVFTASSIKEVDGCWMNWRGDVFDPENGCWITKDGEAFSDQVSRALWGIYSDTKQRRIRAVV